MNLSNGQFGLSDVSRETNEQLSHFVAMIKKWNRSINLVSPTTLDDIWDRHIADSAQLLAHRRTDHDLWVDFGSGGGLPALVLAILAKGNGLEVTFRLVESDQRKAVFLNQVIRELGLVASVLCDRVENLRPLGANIVSARAVASLEVLCGWAQRHLVPGGRAIFPKGIRSSEEVLVARRQWAFDIIEVPSMTDAGAKVLILENICHV